MESGLGGEVLRDKRFVSVEFMYKPRPSDTGYDARRRRSVFDYALKSRLDELAHYPDSALILCCNDQRTADSLSDLREQYPTLPIYIAFVNPEPHVPPYPDAQTPFRCEWDDPAGWQQVQTTDRWARIRFALELGREIAAHGGTGYIVMPAHDSCWYYSILDDLAKASLEYAKGGLPAAVSPYADVHHSRVPGVYIPQNVIDTVNWAFHRHHADIAAGSYQQFWGKMGIIPYAMSGAILKRVELRVWEDDLEIDTAIRALGYAVVTVFMDRLGLRQPYKQTLPAFNVEAVAAVFNRTLHYSLPIPPGNTSLLARPFMELWMRLPDYALKYWYRAACIEAIVAYCQKQIDARLKRYGCSWVDWGAYRHVVRIGDPFVQVWKYGNDPL